MDADAIVAWMSERERRWPWWVGFGVTAAFALFLTVLAYAGRLPPELFERDKAIHFGIAGLLAFFLDRATGARSVKFGVALLLLFGVEELAQGFSVYRTSSIADYAADVAGVVVFSGLSRALSKSRRANATHDVAE
jgi:hypothetical protein